MTQDERHWVGLHTCLTILTIETAAMAAAFLIPGTGNENTGIHRLNRKAATARGK